MLAAHHFKHNQHCIKHFQTPTRCCHCVKHFQAYKVLHQAFSDHSWHCIASNARSCSANQHTKTICITGCHLFSPSPSPPAAFLLQSLSRWVWNSITYPYYSCSIISMTAPDSSCSITYMTLNPIGALACSRQNHDKKITSAQHTIDKSTRRSPGV